MEKQSVFPSREERAGPGAATPTFSWAGLDTELKYKGESPIPMRRPVPLASGDLLPLWRSAGMQITPIARELPMWCEEGDDCPAHRTGDERPFGTRFDFRYADMPFVGILEASMEDLLQEGFKCLQRFRSVADLALTSGELGFESETAVNTVDKILRTIDELFDSGTDLGGKEIIVNVLELSADDAESVLLESERRYGELGLAYRDNRLARIHEAHSQACLYTERGADQAGVPTYYIVIPKEGPCKEDWARMVRYHASCSDDDVDDPNNANFDIRKRMAAVAFTAKELLHELAHVAFDRVHPFAKLMQTPEQHLNQTLRLLDGSLGGGAMMGALGGYKGSFCVSEMISGKLGNFWAYNCFGTAGPGCAGSGAAANAGLGADAQWQLYMMSGITTFIYGDYLPDDFADWLCKSVLDGESTSTWVLYHGEAENRENDWGLSDLTWTQGAWFPG